VGQRLAVHLKLGGLIHCTPSFSEARSGRGWRDFSGTFASGQHHAEPPLGVDSEILLISGWRERCGPRTCLGRISAPPKPISKLPLGLRALLQPAFLTISILAGNCLSTRLADNAEGAGGPQCERLIVEL